MIEIIKHRHLTQVEASETLCLPEMCCLCLKIRLRDEACLLNSVFLALSLVPQGLNTLMLTM
jgi:hypothetical protein